MTIIESTIAFLFRPSVKLSREDRHRQRTCRILRDITDPAEAVGECLADNKNDATTKAATRTDDAAPDRR